VERGQLDEGVWFTRPLASKVLDAACKDVKYLCRLHSVLFETCLVDRCLYSCIGRFVSSVRKLSNDQYEDYIKQGVR